VLHGPRARQQFESALETSNGDPIPPPLTLHLALDCEGASGDPLDAMVRHLDMLRRRLDPDRELSAVTASLGLGEPALPLLADLVEAAGKRFPLAAGVRRPWLCLIRGEQRLRLQRALREVGFEPVEAHLEAAADALPADRFGIGPGAESAIGGWQFLAPAEWRDYRSAIDAWLYPVVQARQVSVDGFE
jgi:hypothetical protein